MPASQHAAIDRFLDALWIEEGLAANTLAAYRRDLTLFARWLDQSSGAALVEASETDLRQYALARHAGSAATSANRRLSVFKRYFRWALRERLRRRRPDAQARLGAPAAARAEVAQRGAGRGAAGGARRRRRRSACATARCSS